MSLDNLRQNHGQITQASDQLNIGLSNVMKAQGPQPILRCPSNSHAPSNPIPRSGPIPQPSTSVAIPQQHSSPPQQATSTPTLVPPIQRRPPTLQPPPQSRKKPPPPPTSSQVGPSPTVPPAPTRYPIFDGRLENPVEDESLPPYIEEPPAYSSTGLVEPMSFAKYLFQFGFLFPPFWILGGLILFSTLRVPDNQASESDIESSFPAWLPEKSEDERDGVLEKMRLTEVKWAKRCLMALAILFVVGGSIGFLAWDS
ncbi:hypothetical protein K435DRAFT_776818 [Dendrothele bispora CBS 962.96]|uniref:Transmembrane protein n=1 Tax=Dendrothele bispora (strain CBS 962.96) TaxID=1314807 RepID=A0A4S8MBT5_DENBC|nr:hypothetical protein K435DRAFT_776818 [Dendrothele bispora CBS 962.96]